MNTLNFSDNIVKLRREKKVTQEQLADFAGVTKASVSKWETKQSMPDILLLPKLAAYFDVTIDELLGYEPQLAKEQIQKIYLEFAADFARLPFEDVMAESETLVKKYYSCYPFLFQMSCLWMNHFMLAEGEERQKEVLCQASDLCGHIISECKDMKLWNNTVIMKATIDLQLGKAQEVIETLEEVVDPYSLSGQSDGLMIRAYLLAGKKEKADSFTQISMFSHLLSMILAGIWYISNHGDKLEICEEAIRRIDSVMEVFHVSKLNPNTAALFHYQAAVTYCMYGKKKEALDRLRQYAASVRYLLADDNLTKFGDEFFNLVGMWYENSELGANAPRDKKVIYESALQIFENPVFAMLGEEREFRSIKISLTEMGDYYDHN